MVFFYFKKFFIFFIFFLIFSLHAQEVLEPKAPKNPVVDKVLDPLIPEIHQEFGVLTIEKKVKRGDVFVFRILLEQENDILVISQIEKQFFQNISIENLYGEMVFNFRALKVGVSEIVLDRVSDSLHHPYIKYRIFVQPSEVDLSRQKAKKNRFLKEKKEREAKKKEIEALILQGLFEKASERLDSFISLYAQVEEVRELVEKIAENIAKKKDPQKALKFVEKLVRKQDNSNISITLQLYFAKLLQKQGHLKKSSEELLKILEQNGDVKPENPQAIYVAQAFFYLGEALFKEKLYQLSRSRYQQFIAALGKLGTEQKRQIFPKYIVAHFRIAKSYELDSEDRDYEKAFEYYDRVDTLSDKSNYDDEKMEEIDLWKAKSKEKKVFFQEHFLNVR